ncbi:universal stress protein [Streptomyces sp. NPDC058459]|uniref:universal stress protein n=1 Tax=Streptomyces sp. NPDC058459 TaxID=3346508 RepID=UPI00365AB167
MRRTVTAGLDGSAESRAAVEWAAREAMPRGLPLRLVQVWEPAARPAGAGPAARGRGRAGVDPGGRRATARRGSGRATPAWRCAPSSAPATRWTSCARPPGPPDRRRSAHAAWAGSTGSS